MGKGRMRIESREVCRDWRGSRVLVMEIWRIGVVRAVDGSNGRSSDARQAVCWVVMEVSWQDA